jgi:hypothetical protein
MTKVDWLAAGVFLIPSSVGLVNDQKKVGMEFAPFSRPAALINTKKMETKYKRSGVLNWKKYKNIFSKEGEKF